AVEMADANDDDFAQPAVEIDLPAHRIDQVEPDFGDGRAVQQELVDVDNGAAPAAANSGKHGLEFRMLFRFDQGNTGHGTSGWDCAAACGSSSFPVAATSVRDRKQLLFPQHELKPDRARADYE